MGGTVEKPLAAITAVQTCPGQGAASSGALCQQAPRWGQPEWGRDSQAGMSQSKEPWGRVTVCPRDILRLGSATSWLLGLGKPAPAETQSGDRCPQGGRFAGFKRDTPVSCPRQLLTLLPKGPPLPLSSGGSLPCCRCPTRVSALGAGPSWTPSMGTGARVPGLTAGWAGCGTAHEEQGVHPRSRGHA